MPDPVRVLTRLLRWGSNPGPAAQPAATPGEVSLGADSPVARRIWGVLESHALSGRAMTGEALRAAVLPGLKRLIAEERGCIHEAHRQGAGGLEGTVRHAELMDAVVCQTFRLADAVSLVPRR